MCAQVAAQASPVIGWIHGETMESQRPFMPAFHHGLAETGFIENRNVAIEHVWTAGQIERRPALTADLVHRSVALIVVDTTQLAQVAKAATTTIPVVFRSGGDAVEFGLVASYNRPGANLTGVAALSIDLTSKRLDVLHKMVPGASIGVLVGSNVPQYGAAEARDLQSAARALGLRIVVRNVATENEIAPAFATLVDQKVGALLMSSNLLFQNARDRILALAARQSIPTMFAESASVEAGALSSYGPDQNAVFRQLGLYVGRILKGEKPADLPVVQPSNFELVINLKTAKALGLTIPETLLATADEVIQ
jgi:putative ABC transport system substrate-binding protein